MQPVEADTLIGKAGIRKVAVKPGPTAPESRWARETPPSLLPVETHSIWPIEDVTASSAEKLTMRGNPGFGSAARRNAPAQTHEQWARACPWLRKRGSDCARARPVARLERSRGDRVCIDPAVQMAAVAN